MAFAIAALMLMATDPASGMPKIVKVSPSPQIKIDTPPRIVVETPYRERQMRDRRSRAIVAIDVTAGPENLWKGSLRAGGITGASVERSMMQAMPIDCQLDDQQRSQSERNSFSLRLNNPQFPDGQVQMSFNISWQRPAVSCAEAQFTKGVSLSGSLQLEPGKTITVQGDGGLVARFTLVSREVPKD